MGRIPLGTTESVADTPPASVIKNPTQSGESTVEVPYTDYESQHSHPYLVDHFKLGDRWSDPDGGFPHEIAMIETFMYSRIKSGEVANSVDAIKNELKSMEKFNNLKDEERAVVKLEILSHYVEFMMKNDHTKEQLRRYGNI